MPQSSLLPAEPLLLWIATFSATVEALWVGLAHMPLMVFLKPISCITFLARFLITMRKYLFYLFGSVFYFFLVGKQVLLLRENSHLLKFPFKEPLVGGLKSTESLRNASSLRTRATLFSSKMLMVLLR